MGEDRFNRAVLVQALKEAGGCFKGNSVCCPFHDDKNPSGSIYQGTDSVWRYKCQSVSCAFCGDIYDVRAKTTGKPVKDFLPKKPPSSKPFTPRVYKTIEQIESLLSGIAESKYIYTSPDTGKHDLVVLRYKNNGKKVFKQLHGVDGGYIIGAPPKPWPIYNRSRLKDSNLVFVVEGEKCVHALHELDIVATTSPAGAGKAEYADWSLLADKCVFLWPDNDDNGIRHMEQVKSILEQLDPAPRIYWIDPKELGLPEKQDVVDYLQRYPSDTLKIGAMVKASDTAKECSIAADFEKFTDAIIDGTYAPVEFPWRSIGGLTRALLPGTVMLLCGDPGSTKSFMLLQAAAYWYEQGVKVALYELEEDRKYHLYRALAQRVGKSDLFDYNWVRANADLVRQIRLENKDFINRFGSCIAEAPDKQTTLEQLAEWVEAKAKAGYRIIAIDPVTAAEADQHPWIADGKFIMRVKAAVRQYGASLILVTHPKKGRKQVVGLDELAGGAAYVRFAQTVLWLESFKNMKDVTVATSCGRANYQINRSLRICKTRNGAARPGLAVGYQFDGKSLTFTEKGVIVPDDE